MGDDIVHGWGQSIIAPHRTGAEQDVTPTAPQLWIRLCKGQGCHLQCPVRNLGMGTAATGSGKQRHWHSHLWGSEPHPGSVHSQITPGQPQRMSPPSHIPAVFLAYLHNLQGWKKKRLILSPCVSLLSPSPVTMEPTRDQRPDSPQEAEKPRLAWLTLTG